jgi:hypothetical protein
VQWPDLNANPGRGRAIFFWFEASAWAVPFEFNSTTFDRDNNNVPFNAGTALHTYIITVDVVANISRYYVDGAQITSRSLQPVTASPGRIELQAFNYVLARVDYLYIDQGLKPPTVNPPSESGITVFAVYTQGGSSNYINIPVTVTKDGASYTSWNTNGASGTGRMVVPSGSTYGFSTNTYNGITGSWSPSNSVLAVAGQNYTFTVTFVGSVPPSQAQIVINTYAWSGTQYVTCSASGTCISDVDTIPFTSSGGIATVTVTTGHTYTFSSSYNGQIGTAQPSSVSVNAGQSKTVSIYYGGSAPPPPNGNWYDWFNTATAKQLFLMLGIALTGICSLVTFVPSGRKTFVPAPF